MGIWYQLLIEIFQAEIPLFGPILTSVFALYPWIRLGLAGTGAGSAGRGRDWMALGLGSAGHRPGLKLEFPA